MSWSDLVATQSWYEGTQGQMVRKISLEETND